VISEKSTDAVPACAVPAAWDEYVDLLRSAGDLNALTFAPDASCAPDASGHNCDAAGRRVRTA
jgi:hypothetical protein